MLSEDHDTQTLIKRWSSHQHLLKMLSLISNACCSCVISVKDARRKHNEAITLTRYLKHCETFWHSGLKCKVWLSVAEAGWCQCRRNAGSLAIIKLRGCKRGRFTLNVTWDVSGWTSAGFLSNTNAPPLSSKPFYHGADDWHSSTFASLL